jgi:hypothetical protein
MTDRRLDLLALRARDMRDKVLAGRIGFADAVDLCYSAAVWSDLVADVGDDAVQYVLATAFMDVPMEERQ